MCYQAAIARRWDVHPVIRPIAEACNVYWLCHQASDTEGRRRFSRHYAEISKKFLVGEPLETPKALPDAANSVVSNRAYSASWPDKIQQRADRILAIPGVLDAIRRAKTAREKRQICTVLLERHAGNPSRK